MVEIDIPGSTKKFVEFFDSLKGLGVKVWHDDKEKEIMIKGRLRYACLDGTDITSISVSQNGFDIEYINSGKFKSVLVWEYEGGKRELKRAVSVEGIVTARFTHSYLTLKYSDIYEIKTNVEYVESLGGLAEDIRGAGFSVVYYPEKREIRIKGDVVGISSFIDPRVKVILSSDDTEMVLFMDGKDYRLKVVTGYSETEYHLGKVDQVEVEVEDDWLIIRGPAVKELPY